MPTIELKKRPEVKYQKIADVLRERIRRGDLKPGDRLPSLSEMNEQDNLSRTTVERVHRMLESDGLVIREHGRGTYVAKPAERSGGLIGFSGAGLECEPRTPYWSHILEGVQQAAARLGQSIVLLNSRTYAGLDSVDGILIADPPYTNSPQLSLPPNLPRISVLFESTAHASVGANDYRGGLIATEHLLSLGHRRIACLMTQDEYPTNRRFAGYRDALKAAGVQFDERWARNYQIPGDYAPHFTKRGAQVMREWLSEDWNEAGCTAIITQNDMVAVGVLGVLAEAGISVPRQVSVVGFDNQELCEYVSPKLTTVDVPLREIAMTALELLMLQIETGRRTPAMTMLPVQMKIRESTAPPARLC